MTSPSAPFLRLLGSFSADGIPGLDRVAEQPKRLALLVYLLLALPRGMHQRDKLVALFWPELDEAHARNSLSKALQFLRTHTAEGSVEARGAAEVGIPPSRIDTDVARFETALAAGDFEAALGLYRGDLLEGFHVGSAAEFSGWLDGERNRYRRDAVGAARALSKVRLGAGELSEATSLIRWASARSIDDETLVREDLTILGLAGDRVGALELYSRFALHLKTEFESEPSSRTRGLIEDIKSGALSAPGLSRIKPAG